MNKAKQEAPRHKRQLCLGTTAVGALGIGVALAAIKIDAVNNYAFGLEFMGQEAAYGFALGAAALAIVPMLAAVAPEGWDRILRIVFWTSVIATVLAAVNAYGVKQGTAIDAAKGAKDRYEQAQQDRDQARKDLGEAKAAAAAIAETVPAAELQRLYDDAKARRDAEANDPKRGAKCGDLCRKAEADMNAYGPRIATARAKDIAIARADKAQARIDAAKVEGSAGPKDQAPLAKTLASWTGTTAEKAAEQIALLMASVMIVLSVSAGMLFDGSFRTVRRGLGYGLVQEPAPVQETAPDKTEERAARRLAMLAAMTDEERLDHFVLTMAKPLIKVKPMTAKALYEVLAQWWLERLPGVATPSQRKLAERMKVAQLRSVKLSGAMVYGAEMAA